MATKYRMNQPKLGNNGNGSRVSTYVKKPLPMVEEVPRARLPAPKAAPVRAQTSRLGAALKIGAKATIGVTAATYSKGLNTGEDAELARRRNMAPTIDKPKAATKRISQLKGREARLKPIQKAAATKSTPVKSVTTVASQANAGTAAKANTDTKFVGSPLKAVGVNFDGGMSERVSKLGEVNSSVMTADLTEAGLKKAGLAASNSEGFGGSFKRLFEGNIDQKGSEAYNKYGAGRGLAELAKKKKK